MSDWSSIYAKRADKLERLRSDPTMFAGVWSHYADNPVDFINDWGITYDPRVKPSYMPFILYERQAEWVDWLYQCWKDRSDGLTEKSRDFGATWVACAFSVWLWLFKDGEAVAWGSRKEELVDRVGDPKSIFEKMRIFIGRLPKEFLPVGYDERKHATYMKIINPENNSTITGEAGDNIGRGGRSSIYFKDESAFYERPERIEAALSQNSDVKIDISTPNGNGNPFYRKRFGGNIPVFTMHWRDDPRKDEKWYEKQNRDLDPVIVAQEVDISYDASVDNALIPGPTVDVAMRTRPKDLDQDFAPIVLGVDPARYGSDRTAMALRQGRVCHWVQSYQKLSTMETVGLVTQLLNDIHIDAVFIDVGGLGAGVVDRLDELYPDGRIIGVNFGSEPFSKVQYRNKRAEMWGEMKQWLIDEPVSIPNDQALRTDLTALLYTINSNGQMVLETKDDAKKRGVKSPDIADALALTFASPVTVYTEDYETYNDGFEGRSSLTGY